MKKCIVVILSILCLTQLAGCSIEDLAVKATQKKVEIEQEAYLNAMLGSDEEQQEETEEDSRNFFQKVWDKVTGNDSDAKLKESTDTYTQAQEQTKASEDALSQAEDTYKNTSVFSKLLSKVPIIGKLTKASKAKAEIENANAQLSADKQAEAEAAAAYEAAMTEDKANKDKANKVGIIAVIGIAVVVLIVIIRFLTSRGRRDASPVQITPLEHDAAPTSAVSGNYNRNKALEKWCKKAGISEQEALSATGGDQEAAVQYAMDKASGLR